MASLEMIEKVAELCQRADSAYVDMFVPEEIPLGWQECSKSEWRERVFGWFVGGDEETAAIEGSIERTQLFIAVCGSMIKRPEKAATPSRPTLKEVPPNPTAVEVQTKGTEGGWVEGPDGKNHWVGPVKPDRPLRTASQEELAKINARIKEAELAQKAKDGSA